MRAGDPFAGGKYTLNQKIRTSGMAEVWLARQHGSEGFEKEVVIKRILPHLADDEKLITMFLDEARIAANLSHPNVIQIFDLGSDGQNYFITMEYIRGYDLEGICAKLREERSPFPYAYASRIMADVCLGLAYAHDFRTPDGTHQNVVHRDVSPQNILVSLDGVVKLIDFGIAKARSSSSKTQAGHTKGKICYMSPEQMMARELDRRSDIFSAGVVLYEMVCGVKAFEADNLLACFHKLMREGIPDPASHRSDIPDRLRKALLSATNRDREERYPTASALREELEGFLRDQDATVGPEHVADFLRWLFTSDEDTEVVLDFPKGRLPLAFPGRDGDAGKKASVIKQRPELTGESDKGTPPLEASSISTINPPVRASAPNTPALSPAPAPAPTPVPAQAPPPSPRPASQSPPMALVAPPVGARPPAKPAAQTARLGSAAPASNGGWSMGGPPAREQPSEPGFLGPGQTPPVSEWGTHATKQATPARSLTFQDEGEIPYRRKRRQRGPSGVAVTILVALVLVGGVLAGHLAGLYRLAFLPVRKAKVPKPPALAGVDAGTPKDAGPTAGSGTGAPPTTPDGGTVVDAAGRSRRRGTRGKEATGRKPRRVRKGKRTARTRRDRDRKRRRKRRLRRRKRYGYLIIDTDIRGLVHIDGNMDSIQVPRLTPIRLKAGRHRLTFISSAGRKTVYVRVRGGRKLDKFFRLRR